MDSPCKQALDALAGADRPAPAIRYPSWLDALFVTRACYYQYDERTYTATDIRPIAEGNPARVAIGFTVKTGTAGQLGLAPHAMPSDYPWEALMAAQNVWYTIWDFPGAVQSQWWGRSTGNITYLLEEVLQTG